MGRKKVAVLRGGASNEYEVSLKTGASVLTHLNPDKYTPVDVVIDKKGAWHVRGVAMSPERALTGVDVVWIALHGAAGESGEVQRRLDAQCMPYTGAGAYASAVCYNKELSKDVLATSGIRMPRHVVLTVSDALEEDIRTVFRTFPHPCVVKPTCSGSSVGISLAHDFGSLKNAVREAFQHSARVLIEEFVQGKEATVGVVEGLRGEDLYILPPIEIIPPKEHSFFDYEAKYSGETLERCPGNFTAHEKEELSRAARLAHEVLGLTDYSRTDFIVSEKGVYYLETNSMVGCGLTKNSLLPKALRAVGVSLPEFIDHVLNQALERKR